jgi:2-aminoethylphosphonate-pyruvate transaminase
VAEIARVAARAGRRVIVDALKRRGYIIYAGQGDIRTYAFRVSIMGTLAPRDVHGVVEAFADSLSELGRLVPGGG